MTPFGQMREHHGHTYFEACIYYTHRYIYILYTRIYVDKTAERKLKFPLVSVEDSTLFFLFTMAARRDTTFFKLTDLRPS